MTSEEFLIKIDEANMQHRYDEIRRREKIERGRQIATLVTLVGLPIAFAIAVASILV